MNTTWDCVVVGGGAAGLSASLVLGRARRRTLLVDAGQQSNLAAHGIGGLLGHDGRPPGELYEAGRREIAAYPSVEVRTGEVVAGERAGDVFELELSDGRRERTRLVLLCSTGRLRCPGSRSCGGGRCSTARSATAGRFAINRWRYWRTASGECIRRYCSEDGATTLCS